MDMIEFGRSGLAVSRTGFGMLPLQRISFDEAARLLRRAVDAGVTFFDTARAYSDSEEKLAYGLHDVRDRIIVATKTAAQTAEGFWRDLKTSLDMLKTDYIDIYQFHNPPFVPVPGGADGLCDAALEAKRQGKIRAIGITQHTLKLAERAVLSGLYESLQYPFNHLASDEEVALVRLCEENRVGFIAMKALSGGLVTDARLPFAYLNQFPGVVPIWGMQRMSELEQILEMSSNPPALDDEMRSAIDADRAALSGAFCRSCGYCMPCPVGIPIANANRMIQLLTRSPSAQWVTPEWQAEMAKVDDCTGCELCHQKCPYGLKPYETMPEHLAYYRQYLKESGV